LDVHATTHGRCFISETKSPRSVFFPQQLNDWTDCSPSKNYTKLVPVADIAARVRKLNEDALRRLLRGVVDGDDSAHSCVS
jgi:hypothetical protein